MDNLPLSEFLTYYDNLVPNIYIPEPSVMLKLLETIELAEPSVGREILPRLWSQMIMFNQMYRNELVEKAIDIMRTNCAPPEDSPFNKIFADAAWYYWNHVAVCIFEACKVLRKAWYWKFYYALLTGLCLLRIRKITWFWRFFFTVLISIYWNPKSIIKKDIFWGTCVNFFMKKIEKWGKSGSFSRTSVFLVRGKNVPWKKITE